MFFFAVNISYAQHDEAVREELPVDMLKSLLQPKSGLTPDGADLKKKASLKPIAKPNHMSISPISGEVGFERPTFVKPRFERPKFSKIKGEMAFEPPQFEAPRIEPADFAPISGETSLDKPAATKETALLYSPNALTHEIILKVDSVQSGHGDHDLLNRPSNDKKLLDPRRFFDSQGRHIDGYFGIRR